jgi:Ca-activated chloride channel family protein
MLLYLTMACLIIGLARPQFGRKETEVTSEGIDIMLALDASGSMAAMDFKLDGEAVDRLTVVKKVVADFLRQQKGDRLGMVIFGEEAYTQSPLTLDYDVLIQLLDHISIGIAGDGTAIGDGLALAVKRLKDLPGKSRVVILLTDGRNNAGKISPEKAAEIAKAFGIKVYTIGIGTKGPVPFPQPGIFGNRLVYVNLDIDEKTLEAIAGQTGGRHFFATDTRKLEEIYREIGRLEKTEAKVKHYEYFDEYFIYFAYAGLALLFLDLGLKATWLRRLA